MIRLTRTTLTISLGALLVSSLAVMPATAQETRLRMTALTGSAGTGTAAAIEAWNAANPDIQVDLELQSDELTWQATAPTTMFASADGPDLSWWWCSPSFQYKDMIAANMLLPLNDIYPAGLPEGTKAYFTEPDGNIYGINSDVVWTPIVYYNKKMFADLGLEEPKTWDELYAIADKVRGAGFQPLVTLFDYGMVNHLPDGLMMRTWSQEQYNAMLRNWSPDSTEAERAYKWTDPDSVRLFQTLKDMVDNGLVADGFAGIIDNEVAKSMFTSGKAAMYQSGSWDAAGGLEQDQFEVGSFYYPPIREDAYGAVGSWVPNCFIAFDRGNVEATKKVMAYLGSAEGAEIYARSSGQTVGRSDISLETLTSFMAPMTAKISADVGTMGAPALYESAVPADVLNAFKRTAAEVLTGVITPEAAGAQMEAIYEEARNR